MADETSLPAALRRGNYGISDKTVESIAEATRETARLFDGQKMGGDFLGNLVEAMNQKVDSFRKCGMIGVAPYAYLHFEGGKVAVRWTCPDVIDMPPHLADLFDQIPKPEEG